VLLQDSNIATTGDITTIGGTVYGDILRGFFLELRDPGTGNLRFFSNSTLTADRILTFDVNNATRTITFMGNPTLADWFDQPVKAASTGVAFGDLAINTTDLVVADHIVEIGSADGSDKIQIYHDNLNTYFKTNDGHFIFQTDEGTNKNTWVDIKGKGSGKGYSRVYDEDDKEYVDLRCSSGHGILSTSGVSPQSLRLQGEANIPITMFYTATTGQTQELQIYGFKTDDELRHLDISISPDADDTALYSNIGTHHFDGAMKFGDAVDNLAISNIGIATMAGKGKRDLTVRA
ncbi:unnamed protein product, partial [marine sediment metagenome]